MSDGRIAKGEATRAAILGAAAELFGQEGYEAVSIEAVLAASGVTRGALYHHFASKEALFEAVFEAAEREIAGRTRVRAASALEALIAGCQAFLELAQAEDVRRIVLTDAPMALGWSKARQIDGRHGFGLLKTSVARAGAAAGVAPDLVEPVAHMLLAALNELAVWVGEQPSPEAASSRARAAFAFLASRLLGVAPTGEPP
jgi:AcrR family transcriptional regulator